jgi:tRNA(fMet)-specific endonuclease VapC
MRTLLLDTNIVSYLFKRASQAKLYEPHLRDSRLAISFVTLAELYRWPIIKDWGEVRRRSLESQLRNYLVIPFDNELCQKWAEITSIPGQPLSYSDSWIAATALRHGIPVVTHNGKHFENIPRLTLITEKDP